MERVLTARLDREPGRRSGISGVVSENKLGSVPCGAVQ